MGSKSNSASQELKQKAYDEFSIPCGTQDGLNLRKIEMKTDHEDPKHKVRKVSIGPPSNKVTKVILLVGATGTGKTTLINNMVNYILKVDFADPFRFILIDDKNTQKKSQAESQTDWITAYIFNHIDGMPFEYSYILIDTPGFGDTRGIQRDREMMQQMKEFLQQDYGIDSVDGVGFVTPASAARLTQTQTYVYEGLSSMFGKDIKDNIYVMATFADAKTPPVLEALKKADVRYTGFYKFNNSALYANNKGSVDSDADSDDDGADEKMICELFWDMGVKSLGNFFLKLGKTTPASLTLTKEVLGERTKLQMTVVSLQNMIKIGLGKLSNLQKEKDMLNRIADDMKGSENHTEVVEVPKIIKIDLNPKEHVTNCIKCNMTCHYPCYIPDDSNKARCWAMTNNYCRICVSKCKWDMHKNMKFRFETKYTKENRTVDELMKRYNVAKSGKAAKEQAVKAIEDDMNQSAADLLNLIQTAQKHVERLEEIALKPNPLSTKEYIELMIDSEKMTKQHNWETRVKMLEELKNEASVLQGVRGKPKSTSGAGLFAYFSDMISKA